MKPSTEFYKRSKSKDGLQSSCKECEKLKKREKKVWQKPKAKATFKKWRDKNKDKLESYWLKRSYGVTLEEKNKLLEEQGYCCANQSCRAPIEGKSAHLDHCHETGKVRGVLCQRCNMGLGMFGDNISKLAGMIEYLNG